MALHFLWKFCRHNQWPFTTCICITLIRTPHCEWRRLFFLCWIDLLKSEMSPVSSPNPQPAPVGGGVGEVGVGWRDRRHFRLRYIINIRPDDGSVRYRRNKTIFEHASYIIWFPVDDCMCGIICCLGHNIWFVTTLVLFNCVMAMAVDLTKMAELKIT